MLILKTAELQIRLNRAFRSFRSGEFVIRQQGVLGFVIRQMRGLYS